MEGTPGLGPGKEAMTQQQKAERACAVWNESNPPGTPVQVLRGNGDRLRTRTRSNAWPLLGYTPVVQVEGLIGVYLLDHVEPEAQP